MSVGRHDGRTFDVSLTRKDPRSRGYSVRSLVAEAPTRAVWWTGGVVTDQGQEGQCVGHAVTGEFLASPVRGKLPRVNPTDAANSLATSVFLRARQLDPWPGENYEGTAVNAGMKVGRERGWWDSYHWAFGIDDVKRALLLGPVVIGVEWRSEMYGTDADGMVKVEGDVVGGHALLVTGWTPAYGRRGEVFRWRNSWGPGYGRASSPGNGYVRAADFRRLLDADGEAAVPTGRHLGKLAVAA